MTDTSDFGGSSKMLGRAYKEESELKTQWKPVKKESFARQIVDKLEYFTVDGNIISEPNRWKIALRIVGMPQIVNMNATIMASALSIIETIGLDEIVQMISNSDPGIITDDDLEQVYDALGNLTKPPPHAEAIEGIEIDLFRYINIIVSYLIGQRPNREEMVFEESDESY